MKNLEYEKLSDLKPGDVVRNCFKDPIRLGKGSAGNEFLIEVKFEKKASAKEQPCVFEWWESASVDWIVPGQVRLKKGKKINQWGRGIHAQTVFLKKYRQASCPTIGGYDLAFIRDCPFTVLNNPGDRRLLCIEMVVKSSCASCDEKEKRIHVTQKCQYRNGERKCTIKNVPCSPKDWLEFGIDIGDGPEVWEPPKKR